MIRTFRLIGLCAALSLPVSAAAFELVHTAGTIQRDTTPHQIVTFDLAVLDTLGALGVDVAGVPASTYRGTLSKFRNTPQAGTLFEPDFPAVRKLKPDLIFAGGRSQAAIPELEKLAPTATYTSNPSDFLDSFRRNNLALAQAFGKDAEANQEIEAIDSNVEALHDVNQGKTGAFLFIMRDNVIAHAPGDRFGYMHELTGLASVLPAKEPGTATGARPTPGSPEAKAAQLERAKTISTVAKAQPDWLVVLDRGAINDGEKTAAATLKNHPELSQTDAYKEGRVFYADPNSWYVVTGGLSNLKQITNDLLNAMQ